MQSPRFPAAATLLDAKVCPLDRFDALFTKITQERQIADGYFLQAHPDGATLLFVVNGSPYGAGRAAARERASLEIHEFFSAYARHPESPLSFFVADKRLLLGLMVLFRGRPAQQLAAERLDLDAVLQRLAARGVDAIVGLCLGEEWAVSICTKGRLTANYFPASGAAATKEATPEAQLRAYVAARAPGGTTVEVFEETRVAPAGDVTLVTPETRPHLSEVFLKVAAKVAEEEASRLELEVAPEPVAAAEPEPAPIVEPEPAPVVEAEPAPILPPSHAPEVQAEAPPAPAPSVASQPAAPPAPKGPTPEVALYLGEKQLATFPLAKGELTIGRSLGNDILIDNAGVSRRHAVIRWSGGRASVEDLGSANGTFVNGQKITSHELREGDEITVVKHRLLFRMPKEGEPPKAEGPAATGQKTMYIDPAAIAQAAAGKALPRAESATPVLRPRLILPDLKKLALESEEVMLGSGPDCKIQLSGMFVAKVHARIVPQKEGQYKLIHVAGLAATRVNGEKITEHVLKHGDEIEIGKQKLLFRLER